MVDLAEGGRMQVDVGTAETCFPQLVEAALSGGDVVITREGVPLVRLVPVPHKTFRIGLLKDRDLGAGPDFFEPIDRDELTLWKG
ncbi:type II toxin-antitoxin system Phd/YefM family antitoxin [Pannonibacter indicus]|uniref:type II toxin-antitoxin system Phd/YefM family antitoxin n=1 Tax=Pannonibacter indicus TaxID=466044 RepID=UPI0035B09F64